MKKIFITGVSFFTCLLVIAQPGRHPSASPFERRGHMTWRKVGTTKGDIEQYKIQFITDKLNLSKAEAEKFWPVYNEHKKAVEAIINEKKEDEIQFEEAMLSAKKKYKNELKPILKSEDRINEALKVEREFFKTIRFEMMRRRGLST
jgi:hypothetical protein